jgi:hypothetical protein
MSTVATIHSHEGHHGSHTVHQDNLVHLGRQLVDTDSCSSHEGHHGNIAHPGRQYIKVRTPAHPGRPCIENLQYTGTTVHSIGTVQRSGTTVRSAPQAYQGGLHRQTPPPWVDASFNVRYLEFHIMKRYLVNSPLLRKDPDLPLFFVNEVAHPYCREHTGPDCPSYSNRGQNTLYYVPGGPCHGYFRYYASAWDTSVNVQGATLTPPTDSLQLTIDRWFAFDATSNMVAPSYLKPDLDVDSEFSLCVWQSLYSPITPVQWTRSLLQISVWRARSNNGCPILWDDPELVVLDMDHSQGQEQQAFLEGQYHVSPHEEPTMRVAGIATTTWLTTPVITSWGVGMPSHLSIRLVTTWGVTPTP